MLMTSWRKQIIREGLAENGLNIAYVAEMGGYSPEPSLSHVFHKQVGMRPVAFRKAAG
jgi:AraC family transcriptional regulator, activator of mtrCDE